MRQRSAGVLSLSKLSKLKQEAYLAGKKRNWDEAVSVYERIIEVDKNNPTLINELGDLCLRKGDIPRAIELFLSAAANYRSTGLHNNAVAIYKKILRHEADNFNAHWSLAELRASQGLSVDGENHALRFLAASDRISSEVKEIFLKRCSQMLALYSNSLGVLEKLTEVFRFWSMPLEAARARALVLCLVYDGGEEEPARKEMADLLKRQRDLENYPEYRLWLQKTQPGGGKPAEYADVNALDLSPAGEEQAAAPSHAGAAKSSPPPEGETSFGGLMDDQTPSPGTSEAAAATAQPTPASAVATGDQAPEDTFDDLLSGIAAPETAPTPAAANAAMPEKSEDGCFEIDADSPASFDDLMADPALVAGKHSGKSGAASSSVDLLAEILADGEGDLGHAADRQVSTIASEIGQLVGGDGAPDDPERQYEMGMVYLEMGMFEQAVSCLSAAAEVW